MSPLTEDIWNIGRNVQENIEQDEIFKEIYLKVLGLSSIVMLFLNLCLLYLATSGTLFYLILTTAEGDRNNSTKNKKSRSKERFRGDK